MHATKPCYSKIMTVCVSDKYPLSNSLQKHKSYLTNSIKKLFKTVNCQLNISYYKFLKKVVFFNFNLVTIIEKNNN